MSATSGMGYPFRMSTVATPGEVLTYLADDNRVVYGYVHHVMGKSCHIIGAVDRLGGFNNRVDGNAHEVYGTGNTVHGNVGRLSGKHNMIYGDVGVLEYGAEDCHITGRIGIDAQVRRDQPIVNICAVSGTGAVNTGTVFVSQVQHFSAVVPSLATTSQAPAVSQVPTAPQAPVVPQAPAASQAPAATGAPSQDDKDKDQNACVICLDEARTHVCVPCMHACLCGGCATALGTGVPCPICRVVVAEVKRFFF